MDWLGYFIAFLMVCLIVAGWYLRRKSVGRIVRRHFRPVAINQLKTCERRFPFRIRADLQRAIESLFKGERNVRFFCGLTAAEFYSEHDLSDVLLGGVNACPPRYEEVDIGEDEPVHCLRAGLWLVREGEVPYAVMIGSAVNHRCGTQLLKCEIATPGNDRCDGVAREFFVRLEKAIARSSCYRGKILSLEQRDAYDGQSSGIHVLKLRRVAREQVILPLSTLELLDRNVIQFVGQRSRLANFGQSTKKGILFYGPPGTGKTHTIHYLAGALEDHTTLLISAEQVGLLDEYMTLARLLQPSIVVLEDVDLIARERTSMKRDYEEVLLNKLLNEMDGLREDVDVLFILTTNRPETLETALASRPGRIDQAIEFPLPDDDGREKLVRLYARGIELTDQLVDSIVRRTESVSGAFIKELMRRAAQFQIERNGSQQLAEQDVENALNELLFAGGTLNLKLLGVERRLTKSQTNTT